MYLKLKCSVKRSGNGVYLTGSVVRALNHHAMNTHMGECRCSYTHFNPVLDGGAWLAPRFRRFTLRYILDKRLGGPQSRS